MTRYFFYKTIILLPVLFVTLVAHAQHTPWRDKEMEVIINFSKPEQATILGKMKLNGDIYQSHACMYLTPSELEKVKTSGLEYSIHIPDLNAWSASFGPAKVPIGYYSFDQIKDIADSLAANFPDICRKVVFGFTPEMKELAALKISDNVNIDENEAEIMFDGGIHGNEVGGSQNVITFARDLCKAYGHDSYITNLINNREIWLYYCVNPFGRDNMTRENGNGIDLNRDFGYAWQADGSSPGPFSQVESKALRDCMYSNQFVSYTNYHSGDEIISYPWSYRYSPTPDFAHISSLAGIYSSNSGYSTLPYGQGSLVMYLINGSTKDFNYGSMGSVAWSIEISLDKQPAGPNIQYYYNINKPAMLALIENAGYGISGTVTDAVTGLPIKAAVWVGSNYPTYTDGDAGDYHKYMIPGSYNLRFSANGYEPKVVNNVVVNALQCTVTDIQLQPKQSQFGYRVCMFNIPAFNAQDPGDEGYTAACLGAPDNVNYSIGKGGYVMVDMQTPVLDEPGVDILVHEGDATPEGYSVYALTDMDGFWNYLGSGTGSAYFDLANGGIQEALYFAIVDDNNGTPSVNDAGFDLDAIENVHAPVPDTLGHLAGKVTNSLTGLPLSGALVTIADSIVVTDTAGYYQVDQIRGSYSACASFTGFNTHCDNIQLPAGIATTHNFSLTFHESLPQQDALLPLSISPNPFTDKLKIHFQNQKTGRVIVRLGSITGNDLITLTDAIYQQGQYVIEVIPKNMVGHELSPGIYLLSIETNTQISTSKLVKAVTR